MTIPTAKFGPIALDDLRERTEYEAWLLEAVYDITDQPIAVEDPGDLIYAASGGPPTQAIHAVLHSNLGDWRPGFLEVGAPLIFVTAFKLLDMLLEWVLTENGQKPSHRFVEKIAAVKGTVLFPPLIGSRSWLQERLVALYEKLEPYRGTITHNRYFKSTGGGLQVRSSKGGTVGPAIDISPEDLRRLAFLLVSLLRYLEGTWAMDAFREKRIRRALDELAHLHWCGSLGQLLPAFFNVRVYVSEGDPIQCDLARIRRDIAAIRPNEDVMFNLRVVSVASDGSRATAYLIPWSQLQDPAPHLKKSIGDLVPFVAEVPAGLDLNALAQDLRKAEH